MIYLIGENLDKTRAHYQIEAGNIVHLMRGIYADERKYGLHSDVIHSLQSDSES